MFERLNVCNSVAAVLIVGSFLLLSAVRADSSAVDPAHPRRCYSCQGLNCYRTSKIEVSSNCTDLLDICVTIFEEYSVVAKGCYLDMPEKHRHKCDQRNNPECLKCFGELCNNQGRSDFKCIQCNSNENSKCTSDTSSMTPVQCSIPTAPNSYCYVKKNGTNVTRGCLLHVKDQQDCMQNDACSMCLSQDAEACNSYQLRSSSTNSAATADVPAFRLAAGLLTLTALIGLK